MSFTDQKPHKVIPENVNAEWSGGKNGKFFRCYLCGHRFQVGDTFRWIYASQLGNPIVCQACDGPDVLLRWKQANEELHQRFWWAIKDW